MSRPARTDARITLVAHPPERGRARSLAPAQAGASCCCCCCCLHSLGALIGAVVGSAGGRRPAPATQEEQDYADFPEQGGLGHGTSAARVFWLSVLVVASVGMLVTVVWRMIGGPCDVAGGFLMGGFGIVMLFPGVLLVAAAVTAIFLAVSSRPDKSREFGQLGRICIGILAGTVIGAVPMIGCVVFMMR